MNDIRADPNVVLMCRNVRGFGMGCRIIHDYSNLELIQAGFLPEKYKDTINLFIFGMESENGGKGLENLLGIAVFSPDGSRFSVMNFLHISVRDKEKENLYAKELFDYAMDQFRQIAVQTIEMKEAVEKEEKDRYVSILSNLGMETDCGNASLMICRQGSFQGKSLDKVYEIASKVENKIVTIQDYFAAPLSAFWKKNAETKFYISFSEYHPRYSRFYLDNGEIKAAVMARKLESGDFLIDGCYVDKKLNQPYIIPYLISVIGHSNKDEIDTSKKLFIRIYKEGMTEALLKFMDEEHRKEVVMKDWLFYKYNL
ncbi:MAG: hypothetical protein ACI4FV_04805 [Lachnospiraceae bacterium]